MKRNITGIEAFFTYTLSNIGTYIAEFTLDLPKKTLATLTASFPMMTPFASIT
jgi:hypothetical protein